MFARAVDASKITFVHLVQQLRRWRFDLIDCQVRNAHMTTLGARDWPRDRFLEVLAHSLQRRTRRGVWHFDEGFDPLETAAPGEAVESVETADSPEAVGLPQAADSRETVDSRRPADSRETVDSRRPAGSRESADPPEAVPPRRRAEPPETA